MSGNTKTDDDFQDTVEAIRAGDRVALGRAITLVESTKPEDQLRTQELLEALLPHTGQSIRIGISGVPGAGKSTLIDQLGMNLIAEGHKVAVLAVDPTSSRTGGSILGDKTRMGQLSGETSAFIRPSPAGTSLGGVTKTTRETIALTEAAGFDVVLVETVGVGQSETAVSGMVDVFVVVAIPGAGDELQGIKRGLLELADIIAVNKADSDNVERANRAATEYKTALHILAAGHPNWSPSVLTMSARDNLGLDTLWGKITERQNTLLESGALMERRADQATSWMREIFEQRLLAAFKGSRRAARHVEALEDKVRAGEMTAGAAAEELGRLGGLKEPKSTRPPRIHFPPARAACKPEIWHSHASSLPVLAPIPASPRTLPAGSPRR